MAAGRASFFATRKLPIGLQLYTLNPLLDADFDGTLRQIAKIGYGAVEMAGYHGRTPKQLRNAFDRVGLVCRSAHIQPRQRGKEPSFEGDLGRLADDMHVIGVKTTVMPVIRIPDRLVARAAGADGLLGAASQMTADDWKASAAFLNDRAKQLSRYGLAMAYHNHNFEFGRSGERTGYDILLAETDPALVTFEMDVGWVAAAGMDPMDLLRRHPGRFRQMHVKDIKADSQTNFALKQDPTEVGNGRIPWKTILPVAYRAGVREYYVEQEPPFAGERIASIAKSFAYLSTLA
jgi:sugar phosphate isomerase/epimerase